MRHNREILLVSGQYALRDVFDVACFAHWPCHVQGRLGGSGLVSGSLQAAVPMDRIRNSSLSVHLPRADTRSSPANALFAEH